MNAIVVPFLSRWLSSPAVPMSAANWAVQF
jgi:hypothetical protein